MNANPNKTIHATWLAMLVVQTIGSVDTKRKLPAPKQYVAVSVLWCIFFFMADTGLAKVAARLSLLVLLTAALVGPFGKRFIDFLNLITKNFAVAPQATGGGSGAPAPAAPFHPESNA